MNRPPACLSNVAHPRNPPFTSKIATLTRFSQRFVLTLSIALATFGLTACGGKEPLRPAAQGPVIPTVTLRGSLDEATRCLAPQIEIQLRTTPKVFPHPAERTATILGGEDAGEFLVDLREKEGVVVAQFIGRGGPYDLSTALRLVRPCV